jgi:hypothetical protein
MRDLDLPGPAADRAILHESLPVSAAFIDVEFDLLSAIGTVQHNRISHLAPLHYGATIVPFLFLLRLDFDRI